MAGGSGTRFWPESVPSRPKQLLDLVGRGRSLLGMAFDRLRGLVPEENVYVVTGEAIAAGVRGELPVLPAGNILEEPVGRNTAPCVGWVSLRLRARDPAAVVGVFPSDHHVRDEADFARAVELGYARAGEADTIVTLGIAPTRPETGYGYIEAEGDAAPSPAPGVRGVRRFVEKPDRPTAEEYVRRGTFYWNGGIFIFGAARMIGEMQRLLPDVLGPLARAEASRARDGEAAGRAAIREAFPGVRAISIDHGVMEKTDRIEVVPLACGWSDLGSWRAIYDELGKDGDANATRGGPRLLAHGARGCLVSAPAGKVVALVGVEGLSIVDTGEALLVCAMDRDQDVREIAAKLGRND